MTENSKHRSAEGKRGLDPKWYLDPDVFRYEAENLFQKSWTPLAHSSQLSATGSFLSLEFNGTPVVLVRDAVRQVRAFLNVCRHRGTQLCHEATGQLKSKHFVCPYHGWKYDLAGNLVAAPNMNDVDGFCVDEFGLYELALHDWNGLLFAKSFTETTAPDEPPAIHKLDFLTKTYPLAEYVHVESISYDVAANWKLIFQNYSECYHCPSVHPQLTPFSDYRESENDFDCGDVLGGPMKIRDNVETITKDGTFCGAVHSALAPSERKNARYYTIFPNLFVSLFPDYLMLHRIRPGALDRTEIVCDFLFPQESVDSDSFQPEKASQFWDLTNRQDWEMCERVQKGIAVPGFRPSPYSNLESLLAAFDEFYLEQMSGFAANR